MKALRSPSLVAAIIIAAGSIGYSSYTAAQVRDLDRRLQRAEALLQHHDHELLRSQAPQFLPPYVPNN